MKRTQIYLEANQKEELQRIAEKSKRTMAEVIREAVVKYITGNNKQTIDKLKLTSGLWQDRQDIGDSSDYIDEMRKKWNTRWEDSND